MAGPRDYRRGWRAGNAAPADFPPLSVGLDWLERTAQLPHRQDVDSCVAVIHGEPRDAAHEHAAAVRGLVAVVLRFDVLQRTHDPGRRQLANRGIMQRMQLLKQILALLFGRLGDVVLRLKIFAGDGEERVRHNARRRRGRGDSGRRGTRRCCAMQRREVGASFPLGRSSVAKANGALIKPVPWLDMTATAGVNFHLATVRPSWAELRIIILISSLFYPFIPAKYACKSRV